MQRCSYLGNNVSDVNEISVEPAKKNKKIKITLFLKRDQCSALLCRLCTEESLLCVHIFSLNFISEVEEDLKE